MREETQVLTQEHKDEMMEKANLLKALSHPIRLCVLEQLINEGEKNVSQFVTCMDVSQSSISQHLGKLRDLEIVETRKEGNRVYYSCKRDDISRLIDLLF